MVEASPATDFSVSLLAEFVRQGIRDVVLSPGSRSQALALGAAEFERAGQLRLHVRIDERVAGFLALGIAAETATPVVVITTSGTAVANLHPAVLEAHHSGIPLILLTADRPPELRGIGSNQTTHQHGLFGAAVRFVRDVEAPSHGGYDNDTVRQLAQEAISAASGHSDAPGPVQLNVAFRLPLSGPIGAAQIPSTGPVVSPPAKRTRPPNVITAAAGTVVIAGNNAGEQAEEVARALGAPLLAEVSSGARFGPNLVVAYRDLLQHADFGGLVRRVIVFGHPTLSREVPALIERDGVETIVVRGQAAEPYNPGHRVTNFVDGLSVTGAPYADRSWVGRWVHTSRTLVEEGNDAPKINAPDAAEGSVTAAFQRQTLAALRAPVTRRSLVESVWQHTWPHDRLVLAASRLIREADRVVPGKKIRVHANRGLAGIDGTVSTALGIARASQPNPGSGGITRVLIGDLALLHDAGAMLFGQGETRPRIQVIVANDCGGTIFDGLEVAKTAPPAAFDRVLLTPQSVDLSALALAYGWEYVLAATRTELDQALTASVGPIIIEVPLTRV
jgi:2-succinyl-5-enolpyruvyl-6-hydroxy-3-cyclohexene-1-carboxylate synthase